MWMASSSDFPCCGEGVRSAAGDARCRSSRVHRRLAPPLSGLLSSFNARRLPGHGRQQPAELEQVIELKKYFCFSGLEGKFLKASGVLSRWYRREVTKLLTMPQGQSGKGVEVVPALLNGRSAVEFVVVEVGVRAL